MTKQKMVQVPIHNFANKNWADLSLMADKHVFVSYSNPKLLKNKFSFKGGHRHRTIELKKDVHWLLPDKAQIYEISDLKPKSG